MATGIKTPSGLLRALQEQHLRNAGILAFGVVVVLLGSFLIGSRGMGFMVVGSVVALIMGALIVVRPTIGVYVLTVFIYLNLSDALEVAFGVPSINKVVVGLVVVAVLANRIMLHHKPLVFHHVIGAILMYGVILLFSAVSAQNQDSAFNYIIDWIKDFAILLIIAQLSDDEHVWKNIQWLLILSAGLLALLSTYQMFTNNFENEFWGLAKTSVHQITNDFDSTRVMGPVTDPNFYAQLILMILPLAVYRAITDTHTLRRLAGAICSALIAGTVVFTYSRAAFLAMGVIGLLIVLERRINLLKVVVGITILTLAAMPLLPPGYLDRLTTIEFLFGDEQTTQTELSFRGRSSEMQIAVDMFLDHPLFGIGISNYETNYQRYSRVLGIDNRAENREAHSLYLEILAETGIVGEVVFLTILATLFLGLHRAMRQLRSIGRSDLVSWIVPAQFGVMAFMLTSVFLHGAYSRYMWLIIGVAIGALITTRNIVAKANAQSAELSTAARLMLSIQKQSFFS